MDLYKFSFVVLTAANSILGYLQYRTSTTTPRSRAVSLSLRKRSFNHVESGLLPNPFLDDEVKPGQPVSADDQKTISAFQQTFFSVYLLVMAADWLQGPYLYTLYKDEKTLPERTVAILFATGFVSAAVSASFVGGLADLHGRKKACLAFCGAYSLSCLSMVSGSVVILFVGRVLGGVSTTLMYSVFETWMVHEFHARQMASKGLVLGKVFGMMTTMSSVVAILAGIIGEGVVGWTGTKQSPFLVAFACLCGAAALISSNWNENFGGKVSVKEDAVGGGTDIKTIVKDKRIVALGLISCLFEGSMYLFVFFWSAALKSARAHTQTHFRSAPPSSSFSSSTAATTANPIEADNLPPFGLIFATFMSAMMLGSQLFTIASSSSPSQPSSPNLSGSNGGGAGAGLLSQKSLTAQISNHVNTLSLTILVAALSFVMVTMRSMSTAIVRKEEIILWSFCLFEAAVGIYYPTMGYIKGAVVADGIRGKVYGLLRLPLNLFVVSVLGVTVEGDRYRDGVFLACGGLLILGYGITVKGLGK